MDRTKSKKRVAINSSVGIASKIVVAVLGLVLRRLFLHNLGAELSGLNSVFLNIIDFLNLATVGFISSITPKLYDYSSVDDFEGLSKTIRLARDFYFLIAIVVFFLGLVCSLFLQYTVADNSFSLLFLQLVFMTQVITQCIRLVSVPWTTLLEIREQAYIAIIYELIVSVAVYVLQGVAVVSFASFWMYLIINMIGQGVLFCIVFLKAKRTFPWLDLSLRNSKNERNNIFSSLRYTIPMQISNFVFMSTDSLIISKKIGLKAANHYSNYMTIAMTVLAMYTMIQSAVNNYYGNRIRNDAPAEEKERFLFFVTHLYYVVAIFGSVLYAVLIDDFIVIWIGSEYVQETIVAILFSVYMFSQMLIGGVQNYLTDLGLFKDELKANVTGAFLNLAISIVLVSKLGIIGVILGTIIGNTTRYIFRMKGCFKNIGKDTYKFIFISIIYGGLFVLSLVISLFVNNNIDVSNMFLGMLVKLIVSLCIVFAVGIGGLWKRWEEIELRKIVLLKMKDVLKR